MSRESSKKHRGTTLVEILVYAALFGFVFTGIYMVFNAAVKYYYVTQSNVWVQQSSLNAINGISREMMESALSSVVLYSSDPKGVVFMSPRDSNGVVSYNTASGYEGKPYWNKYICYYLSTDPSDPSKKVIFRKEASVGTADTPSASTVYTTSYFASGGGSTLPYKITAHGVTDLDIYWLSSSTKTYGTPTVNPVYIGVTAQDNTVGKTNDITTISSIDAMNY